MGREGELWDDSALINAFEDAMSKYKKMHGKKVQDNLTDGGKVASGNGENVSNFVEESHGDMREADENNNVAPNTATELGETENLAQVKEHECSKLLGTEPYVDSSNGPHMQALNGYPYSQGAEDYNQLLSQYYELEEKRQRILQQLHQLGAYNYQCLTEGSGAGVQWATSSASQDHLLPASEASCSSVVCSFCPYTCHCSAAPCTSFAACSFGGTCFGKTCADSSAVMGPGKSFPPMDGDIVQTAMGAAERAISSMKMKTSDNSEVEGKEEREDSEAEINQSDSSETDLGVVLNAWYSAGFYTGKYLAEQSIVKKLHG